MEPEKTLSPEQAGRYLGGDETPLAKKTMDKWRWNGTGPVFIKVGRLIRYHTSDLDAWLATRRRRSTSDQGA